MAAKKGPPKKTGGIGPKEPWRPSPHQMEWYRKWTEEFKGPTVIARENNYSVTAQTVCESLQKVTEWVRVRFVDHTMANRQRLIALHEAIIQKAMIAWEASIGKQVVVTATDGESPGQNGGSFSSTQTRTEVSQGDHNYLKTIQASAAAIAKICGIGEPVKGKVGNQTGGHSENIPGMPSGHFNSREEFRAATLKVMAKFLERQGIDPSILEVKAMKKIDPPA